MITRLVLEGFLFFFFFLFPYFSRPSHIFTSLHMIHSLFITFDFFPPFFFIFLHHDANPVLHQYFFPPTFLFPLIPDETRDRDLNTASSSFPDCSFYPALALVESILVQEPKVVLCTPSISRLLIATSHYTYSFLAAYWTGIKSSYPTSSSSGSLFCPSLFFIFFLFLICFFLLAFSHESPHCDSVGVREAEASDSCPCIAL